MILTIPQLSTDRSFCRRYYLGQGCKQAEASPNFEVHPI